MPFKEPFAPYETGDFIFGINDAIAKFMKQHEAKIPAWDKKERLGKTVTTVRQLSEKQADVEKTFTDDRLVQNLAYLKSLEKQLKYHKQVTADDSSKSGTNAKFRAKSKGALYHLIANEQNLHFVLDGLDLKEVITKTFKDDVKTDKEKYRSVTGAELRWLFRHKDCPKTQKHVQFWIAGKPCPPPWDLEFPKFSATAPPWGTYVPKNGKATVD